MIWQRSMLVVLLLVTTRLSATQGVMLQKSVSQGELLTGSKPPEVILQNQHGGRVDGTPWASAGLVGKVHVLLYVDPDEQELNEHVEQALKKEAFPRTNYASVAVINMAATWIPNFLIAKRLKKKQAEFSHTTFVKDHNKMLVQAWGLKDNSYHIVVFDKQGSVAWSKGGKLTTNDISDLIATIRRHL